MGAKTRYITDNPILSCIGGGLEEHHVHSSKEDQSI